MRVLAKMLTLAAATGALVTGAGAPASANHQCPPTADLCFLTDPLTIPAGTPAAGPYGGGGFTVPGPRLCDSGTGQCTETFVHVPSASVSSTGGTVASITLPSVGFVVDQNGVPTVYYGTPSTGGAGQVLPLGVTIEGALTVNAVEVTPYSWACPSAIRNVEVLFVYATLDTDCDATVTIAL